MSSGLDRRLHAMRDDRAAASLRGKIDAPLFVDGIAAQVCAGFAPLRRRPGANEPLDSQLVYGDIVTLYERRADGWLWVQNERDGYVGYTPADAVTEAVRPATHRVVVNRSFVYPGASIKLPPLRALPMAAEVSVLATEGAFSCIAEGQWMWSSHLRGKAEKADDFVAIAEMMMGAPYLWGGNTPDGTDCSGLLQTALRLVNINAPRDSDMQEASLGEALHAPSALQNLRRGDFIFWKGHVGIMLDADILLHANGHHMLVVREPVRDAIARIAEKGGGPVTAVRRLSI